MRRAMLIACCVLLAPMAGGFPLATAQGLEPIVTDQEQIFDITWQVGQLQGRPILTGRITNRSFFWTARIQLLVNQLDAGGRVVDQQLAWLGVVLLPGERSFFDVSVADDKARYSVQVFAFTRGFGTEPK